MQRDGYVDCFNFRTCDDSTDINTSTNQFLETGDTSIQSKLPPHW